jgi:hypothetical protein
MGRTPAQLPDLVPPVRDTEPKTAIERLFDGEADPASETDPAPGRPTDE